jgi:amino acid permease
VVFSYGFSHTEDFLEGAFGHDAWLYVLEELETHGFEVVEANSLHSYWGYYRLVCVAVVVIVLLLLDGSTADWLWLLLHGGLRVLFVYTFLFFHLYVCCKLVHNTLLEILTN